VLVAFSLLVLATAGVVLLVSLSNLTAARQRIVRHIDPAEVAARDLRAAMTDQETGVRGYEITKLTDFLAPYVQGLTEEADAKNRLEAFTSSGVRGAVKSQIATVMTMIETWSDHYGKRAVEDIRTGNPAPANLGFESEGKRSFDALRLSFDRLDQTLADDRQVAVDQLHDAGVRANVAAVVVLVAFLLVLVVITVTLLRAVLRPLSALGDESRLVVDEDLDHEIQTGGPPEIAELAEDVEVMRRRLVDQLDAVDAQRERLEAQAIELSRSNADLEQFAYVASHDLQEPLRKIAGFCQLLEKRYGRELDDRAREYIFYAVDGANRMQGLINDLLAYSRVGRTTDRFRPVDLGEALAHARAVLSDVIEEAGATIESGRLPTVQGDARLLASVFQNLVGNALKFRGAEAPRIEISSEVRHGMHDVTFRDNGIGVDPAYADQIFVLFKRLHPRSSYEGSGIGLAMAKRIAEFHGGKLYLEPTPPPGATFHLILPLTAPAPIAPDPSLEERRAS
jgi:signal transduction histidine kinase